jgi:hypothetical protein
LEPSAAVFPHFKVGANGFVDTGYGCRSDSTSIIVTGPPPDMISVGGYRFMLEQVQALVHNMGNGAATLAALPDALAGHRLVGSAPGAEAIQHALAEQGINPLISGAFRNKAPGREAGRPVGLSLTAR